MFVHKRDLKYFPLEYDSVIEYTPSFKHPTSVEHFITGLRNISIYKYHCVNLLNQKTKQKLAKSIVFKTTIYWVLQIV